MLWSLPGSRAGQGRASRLYDELNFVAHSVPSLYSKLIQAVKAQLFWIREYASASRRNLGMRFPNRVCSTPDSLASWRAFVDLQWYDVSRNRLFGFFDFSRNFWTEDQAPVASEIEQRQWHPYNSP
jgi:hypothetical protein